MCVNQGWGYCNYCMYGVAGFHVCWHYLESTMIVFQRFVSLTLPVWLVYICHVTSDTTPSHYSHKSWEWPGDEAKPVVYTSKANSSTLTSCTVHYRLSRPCLSGTLIIQTLLDSRNPISMHVQRGQCIQRCGDHWPQVLGVFPGLTDGLAYSHE